MKGIKLEWNETGNTIIMDSKMFLRLIRWLKKDYDIELLSYTGKKPKI
jgi:hypothetical protein